MICLNHPVTISFYAIYMLRLRLRLGLYLAGCLDVRVCLTDTFICYMQSVITRERTIQACTNTIRYEYSCICNFWYRYEYSLH